MTPRVLVAGVSTRAAAESAARAGFDVTAIDGFADLDQHPSVRALSVARDFGLRFSASTLVKAAGTLAADAVAYLSNVDNHPRLVDQLAAGRALWGNTPAVLRRVRDPFDVADVLTRRGFVLPAVRDTAPERETAEWLRKPRQSGGGHHIRAWRGEPLARGAYLQERIDGIPASIVFVAARGRAVGLGLSCQLIGDADFGASGYRYCGSILGSPEMLFAAGTRVADRARALMSALADAFPLAGVNGLDFIVRDDVPLPIEVNPRWCASMELIERADSMSVFGAHAEACATGTLPEIDPIATLHRRVVGKAIVYARRTVVATGTHEWLDESDVRDVPRPAERIPAGRPICTVFAEASDVAGCRAALGARARDVYARVERWRREAA